MKRSILSITPEEQAEFNRRREDRQKALERWRFVAIDGWLAAYQAGRLPLEKLVRVVNESIGVLPDEMGVLAIGGRERLLGHVIRRALDEPTSGRNPQGGRSAWPDKFKEAACGLVALVEKHEGLKVKREPLRRKGGKQLLYGEANHQIYLATRRSHQ